MRYEDTRFLYLTIMKMMYTFEVSTQHYIDT